VFTRGSNTYATTLATIDTAGGKSRPWVAAEEANDPCEKQYWDCHDCAVVSGKLQLARQSSGQISREIVITHLSWLAKSYGKPNVKSQGKSFNTHRPS
jgi:hypothetical protein